MYVGHVGIALALRAMPGAPALALLVLAAQGPDWVELVLEAGGYRWANPAWGPHALPWVALGAVLAAGLAAALAAAVPARLRDDPRARAAVVAALAYASHWPADYLTGFKPTWPGGPMVGRQLYGRPLVDLAMEVAVVTAGWLLWRRSVPRGGPLAHALLAALLALQLAADVAMAHRLGRL
jgi:hypothetical protein